MLPFFFIADISKSALANKKAVDVPSISILHLLIQVKTKKVKTSDKSTGEGREKVSDGAMEVPRKQTSKKKTKNDTSKTYIQTDSQREDMEKLNRFVAEISEHDAKKDEPEVTVKKPLTAPMPERRTGN